MRHHIPARRKGTGNAPPPPYETAVYRRPWAVVAPYVDPSDLYSICLTCRHLHQIFIPYLWGSPATRFGTDSDTVYLSITRFKRLLPKVRLDVRRQAHTLHLPPAEPEFYGGPQAGWLRNILDYLPRLQALVVSSLSFFDHQALQTVHPGSGAQAEEPKYSLRLLIASSCENTTAGSLAFSLASFPDLMYLDLSSTQGSRSPSVLREIGNLTQLWVLKMRNCGLRDSDIKWLTFSTRLRSLDMSGNYLTEHGVSDLVELLPKVRHRVDGHGNAGSYESSSRARSSKKPTLQSFVADKLTSSLDGHIYLEDRLPDSFSELCLAGNLVTVDELTGILTYPTLEYLDAGSLYCSRQPAELLSPDSPVPDRRRLSSTRVDELSPALFTKGFRNVRSLRMHHSVITSRPFSGKGLPTAEQCFELHSEDLRFELDSTEIVPPETLFELDDTSIDIIPSPSEPVIGDLTAEPLSYSPVEDLTGLTRQLSADYPESSADSFTDDHPTFETPDDVGADISPSPSVKARNSLIDQDNLSERPSILSRRNLPSHIFVTTQSDLVQPLHIRSADHNHISNQNPPRSVPPQDSHPHMAQARHSTFTGDHERPGIETSESGDGTLSTKRIIEDLLQRRQRIAARERHPGRFQPSMLPNLEVLTITDVPSTTRRQDFINSLITFIQECAEEEELAKLEDLEFREGRDQIPKKELNASGMFKLQRLVLEMSPTHDPIDPPLSPREKRHSFTKSSTEDPDSEMFMEASESDFSFFGEDDGGLLVSEGKIDGRVHVDNGMIYMGSPTVGGHPVDVISEVASFRREKRLSYEAAVRVGRPKLDIALLGHWAGEIKVVKNFLVG